MKPSEIKKVLITSLNADYDTPEDSRKLELEGVTYDFRTGFSDRVLDKLFGARNAIKNELDFLKSMNFVFYRIAISGVAAIVILLISFFLIEGSISFNSFLGVSDNYDESIVCLLTGN